MSREVLVASLGETQVGRDVERKHEAASVARLPNLRPREDAQRRHEDDLVADSTAHEQAAGVKHLHPLDLDALRAVDHDGLLCRDGLGTETGARSAPLGAARVEPSALAQQRVVELYAR